VPRKKEGWLGLVLTAVLCLGFLYWWFRPARETWQPHSTAQLVARALGEPGLDQPLERLVIDFDLMETAILQARLGMVPEGLDTAARIADPVVQARTIRQLAQAHLSSDAKNLGTALTMTDRIADIGLRARMKEEILLQLAMLGFADVVLPEAKTPLARARLARRLAETDGQDTARTLLEDGEKALPDLPSDQASLLLTELAWTRVHLAVSDGPEQAFAAIRRLPPSSQDALWLDLFRICFGRADTAQADSALVAAQVTSPALRRKMELEALQSNIPLRPLEEVLAGLEQEMSAAPPGAPQIRLWLELADAHQRTSGPEKSGLALLAALETTKALTDPVQRATFLAELAEVFPDALLFAEAEQALTDAMEAARTVVAPEQRVPLLVIILRHAFNAGDLQAAATMAEEALALAPKIKLSPPLLLELTDFLTRLGDWPAALSLLPEEIEPSSASGSNASNPPSPSTPESGAPTAPAPPERDGMSPQSPEDSPRRFLLDALATTAAEDMIGYPSNDPPNRGEPLDRIRNRAVTDEAAAAAYLPGVPAGYPRARATLAIAKGRLLPPMGPDEGGFPGDPSGPLELLPGQEALPPLIPGADQ
jgi:tetratricopeptide (TPR) repeat protein